MLRIVSAIFLFRFFIMASPIVGMFSAFMLEANQTPMGMAFIFVSFMVAMNLFEVPSSIIADKFSRKKVVTCAIITVLFSNLILLFSQTQWAFIFHMVIAGIGVALFSGTVEALMYDELKTVNLEHKYQKANAIYHIARSLGLSTSLFLSSWLVKYGWYTIIVTSLFSCFISLVIFIFGAKETKRTKNTDEAHSMKEIFLEGGKTVLHNKTVGYLALLSLLFGAINCVFGDVAIITSMSIGWDKSSIARVFGFNTLFEAIITFLFMKYATKISIKTTHYILIATLALACVGMIFHKWWSVFFAFPVWWCDRLKNMTVDTQIQHNIKSSSRATTTSFISLCFGAKYSALMLLLGYIATIYSFAFGFVIISIIGIIQLTALLFARKLFHLQKI